METEGSGMQLQEWAIAHNPTETLRYKDGYWDQINFVRDKIAGIFANSYKEYTEIQDSIQVISEHTSKSVLLPVFRIELADGTSFTMRYNFHNWMISVESPQDIDADFMDLFDPKKRTREIYCEGFPSSLVYGPYAENKRNFTIELPSGYYYIFTFFWIFAYQILGIRKRS